MKRLSFILLSICVFISLAIIAQERPPIQFYSPTDYGAETQNWSISQSKENYIYVANNKGLLEYNGAKWEIYPLRDNTKIRSVKVIDSIIYTGSYRDFGFWKRNNLGKLVYTSLAEKLKISFKDDEEIWNVIHIDDWILFQSFKRIYIYNEKEASYSIINSETTIYKIFKVNESIYFQKVKDGVYEIVNGTSKLVSNDDILKENLLVNIFDHEGKLLFQTEDNGFFEFHDTILEKWNITANEEISKHRIYSSIKLKDNSFLLGSISNGIFHLDSNGHLITKINQNSGLGNNTVLSVFEDVERNIWVGLENGINCININSPFSIFHDQEGNIGAVNASILSNGFLYLGTNQGLFCKLYGSDDTFKFIKGTQGAVWCLTKIDDTLFCGHDSGTFTINKNSATKVSDILGTWAIKPIDNRSNLLLQGNYNGLNIIEKTKGNWKFRNKINGFDISSRYFEMYDNQVFVSHEYKGVFKIKLDTSFTNAVKVLKDTSVKKGLKTSLVSYNDHLLYTQKEGIYKYDKSTQKFIKDSIYSKLFNENEFTSGKLVKDDANNTLWAFSLNNISYLWQGKLGNRPKIDNIPLPSNIRSDVSGYENISFLNDNNYLYGSSQGYLIINLDKIKPKSYQIKINLVTNSTYKNGYDTQLCDKNIYANFKNNENNIAFNYSVPEYEKYLVVKYRYKLDRIYNEWSPWFTNSSVLFENLPYGDYKFQVRARIGNTLSENTETYSFSIEKPWYITNIMIATYVLLVLLFSVFMHNVYKRYYRKQRERLLLKNQRELKLKELENRQQLMRFNNDNLRLDIENKNKELGISTMSLIKKNEFLNTLKKEIIKVQDTKNIKPIIKIIDSNINNTDDWYTFEKAFNNADKDFLKKVKSLHPELTSNDLRLCAYLRLNLSSKEIAPLLNISSRSVEVKRYRLRKKMNLDRESSLTDYILEI